MQNMIFILCNIFFLQCIFQSNVQAVSSAHEYLEDIKSSSRHDSMKLALELMDQRQPNVIVETGTARAGEGDPGAMFMGDGGSSVIFGTWAELNNKNFYSVDINQSNIKAAQTALAPKNDKIHFICDDSVHFLSTFNEPIDFLYLDSFDYELGNPGPSQEHHLKEIMSAHDKLTSSAVVMIDDCSWPGGGKGGLVIPYLLERGWKIIYDGFQVILVRPNYTDKY